MQGIKYLSARRRPSAAKNDAGDRFDDSETEIERKGQINTPEDDGRLEFDRAGSWTQALDDRDYLLPNEPSPQMAFHARSGLRSTPKGNHEVAAEPPRSTPVRGRRIWDVEPPIERPVEHPTPSEDVTPEPAPPRVARPASMQPSRPHPSRAKTQLLGFHGSAPVRDIFSTEAGTRAAQPENFPIGWLILLDGPGRGASFTLHAGLSTVGRDSDQTVCLDFGDAAISRSQHVAIAYDSEENRTFIGHGGKQNVVRFNGKPLLTTEELSDGDTFKIGKTTVLFKALCDASFSWEAATGAADD